MRLRNKKTGEIVTPEVFSFCLLNGDENRGIRIKDQWYNSITELTRDWEDYEGGTWYITENGEVRQDRSICITEEEKDYIEIGNRFATREEAEKAVEKLKAWKRLRDNGLKPTKWEREQRFDDKCSIIVNFDVKFDSGVCDKDLDLLFGGEEPVNRDSDETRYIGKEEK